MNIQKRLPRPVNSGGSREPARWIETSLLLCFVLVLEFQKGIRFEQRCEFQNIPCFLGMLTYNSEQSMRTLQL